jgi:hypothetical protein
MKCYIEEICKMYVIETLYEKPSKQIAKKWDRICKEEGGVGFVETLEPKYCGSFVIAKFDLKIATRIMLRVTASRLGSRGGAFKSEKKAESSRRNLGKYLKKKKVAADGQEHNVDNPTQESIDGRVG